jgi:hypothetical protein
MKLPELPEIKESAQLAELWSPVIAYGVDYLYQTLIFILGELSITINCPAENGNEFGCRRVFNHVRNLFQSLRRPGMGKTIDLLDPRKKTLQNLLFPGPFTSNHEQPDNNGQCCDSKQRRKKFSGAAMEGNPAELPVCATD